MAARLALAGVVVFGAALRFYPIWFGLPYAQARPDETTTLGAAVAILSGDPNPHFFHWPSLTFYLFAGLFAAARAAKGTLAYADYTLIARGAVACAGTLTIVLLARTARSIADRSTAIVAAAFLSVAVLHVRESHFAMTDVLMTMWATACLLVLAEPRTGRAPLAMALAGVAGGLATST
jgi:4-amino-4-deoxy-L-arabinose transferase-like glycosyltransferase